MQRVLLAGVVILCVLCSVSYSYTYRKYVAAKHGACYDTDTGSVREAGVYYDMENCERHWCRIINETHAIIHSVGCGVVALDENDVRLRKCYLERRMHLPYPDCCPRPVCHSDIPSPPSNQLLGDVSVI